MSRRSADETRQLLIDTGVAMLHERGVTAAVTHIRLQDVLRRAGLTTGAAYRLWADQGGFHRELAVAATRWRERPAVANTVQAIRALVDRGAPLSDVIRVGAAAHVAGLRDADGGEPPFVTTLALRATAGQDPELRAASRARHAESIAAFTELYGALLAVYGRRVRAPFTLRHFALAAAALGEGFAVQAIEGEPHPVVERTVGGEVAEWTLFGVAYEALVEAFTESVPPGEEK